MSDKATNPAQEMEAFFTRQRANEGIELPLSLPDGTPSPHLIRIRGIDSDAFRIADAEGQRRMALLALEKGEAGAAEAFQDAINSTLAALVVSWTFDTPCTLENVKTFLKEAPQIATEINRLAGKRSLFFKQSLKNSTPSPAQNSS